MKNQQGDKEKQLLPRNYHTVSLTETDLSSLRADCGNCFGLCCVALYFSASEGFPAEKDAGQPCINLQPDFRCRVHESLIETGLKGCAAYECFGAGQKVSQITFCGHNWRQNPVYSRQMFEAFLIMWQLHEICWYLSEALTLHAAVPIQTEIKSTLAVTEQFTYLGPDALMKLDVTSHRDQVNTLLVQTSELVRAQACCGRKVYSQSRRIFGRGADLIGTDLRKTDLRGANLRGACLIAADLRGADLSGTDLIGVDFRDADIRGADLANSIFLTQAQVNTARGDAGTKLPPMLDRPKHWPI